MSFLLTQQSLFIEDGHHRLHLRHIALTAPGKPTKGPVLMLHGVIENGKIFYTHSGKGLACFLAEHGFDVYVADMRGRGLSTPPIKQDSGHDMYDQISRDIPMLIDFVYRQTGRPLHVIAHSWGGVLLASALVRFADIRAKVKSQVCFGSKRCVRARTFERRFKIDVVWTRLAPMIARKVGYLPARQLKIGSDDETCASLSQSVYWVKHNPWVGQNDGFDYGHAAAAMHWPPTWHLAAAHDFALGHPDDVKDFIAESAGEQAEYTLLSKQNGNALNYDHINMLTHPAARSDHFPSVAAWLSSHD